MKFHFEPDLDYQHAAIESVCDLFRGQEICRTEFTVTRDATAAQQTLAFAQSDLGIGNRLQLLDDELLTNLGDIQIRQQYIQAIFASSESFASSSDRTAISRVTVGNCRRKSPSEWPPSR